MDGVVLVLVGHVVGGGRSGVDSGKLAVSIFHDDTGDETSDTSEAVHTHAGGHGHGCTVGGGGLQRGSGEGVGGGRASGGKGESSRDLHGWIRDWFENYRRKL